MLRIAHAGVLNFGSSGFGVGYVWGDGVDVWLRGRHAQAPWQRRATRAQAQCPAHGPEGLCAIPRGISLSSASPGGLIVPSGAPLSPTRELEPSSPLDPGRATSDHPLKSRMNLIIKGYPPVLVNS